MIPKAFSSAFWAVQPRSEAPSSPRLPPNHRIENRVASSPLTPYAVAKFGRRLVSAAGCRVRHCPPLWLPIDYKSPVCGAAVVGRTWARLDRTCEQKEVRPSARFANGEKTISVRVPCRVVLSLMAVVESPHACAIRVHDIDLISALTVACKRDPLPVRRPGGPSIQPRALCQSLYVAAISIHDANLEITAAARAKRDLSAVGGIRRCCIQAS